MQLGTASSKKQKAVLYVRPNLFLVSVVLVLSLSLVERF
jgi:hypothetical protein